MLSVRTIDQTLDLQFINKFDSYLRYGNYPSSNTIIHFLNLGYLDSHLVTQLKDNYRFSPRYNLVQNSRSLKYGFLYTLYPIYHILEVQNARFSRKPRQIPELGVKFLTAAMSFLSHLECPVCSQSFPSEEVQSFCSDCQSPILARYDLLAAAGVVDRDEVVNRQQGMWRWQEFLPVHNFPNITTLGEGGTALLPVGNFDTLQNSLNVWIKDESTNPTASFKARGLSAAVSKARELGLDHLAIPTAGNAGSALAAYASRAGMKSTTVMPADAPKAIINECKLYGADVVLVDGLISDCAKYVSELVASGGWFSVSTFREPYRVEGKKTMGYEIAEQFKWLLPDAIIYPTGGGTGLVGMWKAFKELQELNWLEDSKLPRMIAVQSDGCAPIVKAYESGEDHCEFWSGANTIAGGIRVPHSLADRLILEILFESGGTAIAVSDEDMRTAQKKLSTQSGILSSLEGAATVAALMKLQADGIIQPEDKVVLFITASGLKYL